MLIERDWIFKVRTLHKHFLTRFGGRGNKQTSYIVSRRVHHIYRSLSRRDYVDCSRSLSSLIQQSFNECLLWPALGNKTDIRLHRSNPAEAQAMKVLLRTISLPRLHMTERVARFNLLRLNTFHPVVSSMGREQLKAKGTLFGSLPLEIMSRSDYLSKRRPSGERNQHRPLVPISRENWRKSKPNERSFASSERVGPSLAKTE